MSTSVEYDGTDYEVTGIEDETFYRCSELTSVVLPNGLKSIGEHAFRSCTKLLSVYCYAEDVPSAAESAFEGCYLDEMSLYVPQKSIKEYSITEPWSRFGRIEGILSNTDSLKEEYVEGPADEQKEYYTFTMELKPGKAYRIEFGASAGNPPSINIAISSGTSVDTGVEMM